MTEFFLDRSLGGKVVPQMLRSAGWEICTMSEIYGKSGAQTVDDVTWISEMAARGFCLLTADSRIVSNPIESSAIDSSSAVVFIIPTGAITGTEMALRFITHESGIHAYFKRGGPAAYAVYPRMLSRVHP